MGFFDLFKKKDYKYYLNRCELSIQDDDLGYAGECLEEARKLVKDDDFGAESARAEIEAKAKELKHIIYEKAYNQAKQFFRGGQRDAAQNAVDRAARHVQNDEERAALNKLVEESHKLPTEENVVEEDVPGEENVSGLSSNDKWNLYVTQLSFDRAQQFDELGDEFKNSWVELQEGKFDEAITGIEAVLKDHPNNALVMCELGRAYYGKGELAKADEMLAKSDDEEPDTDTKLLRAEVLWSMKKFDVAEEVLQAAYDADPDNVNVLARIAQHGLITGELDSGIDAVEVLAEKVPRDPSVHRLAGRLYLAKGDDEKALDSFENVNHLVWQVNPQTKQITCDQNSAMAAATLYMKLNRKLDRASELLEAIRANSKGESHVAICMKLAELYDLMKSPAKRTEMLNESSRYMDELLETATGPERAVLNLQYAEISEMLEDTDSMNAYMNEAESFFKKDADEGNPVAAFYMDMIQKKREGKPFPKANEMQKALTTFVEARMAEMRGKAAAQRNEQIMSVSSNVATQGAPVSQKSADDIIARMASMAPSIQTKAVAAPSEDSEAVEEPEDAKETEDKSEDSEDK